MSRKTGPVFLVGLLAGVLLLGGVRFLAAGADPHDVHYHANWALFLDGERVDFTGDRYMEDVQACTADEHRIPARGRVHLHGNDMDVVHIHHAGVTWGHFLSNLGWGLGEDWLVTDEGEVIRPDDGKEFTFIVNGWAVNRLDDRIIDPGDRALIYWGEAGPDSVLERYFPEVATNAAEYDMLDDPGGCGGAAPESIGERVRRAFLF